MTLNAPLLGLIFAAVAAAMVSFRLKLFTPQPRPLPSEPGTAPTSTSARDALFPILVGALAVYSSWMLIGVFVSTWTGLAGYAVAAASGAEPAASSAPLLRSGPPLELVARTHLLVGVCSIPVAVAICWWARRIGGQPLDGSLSRGARVAGQAVLWCLVVLPMVFVTGVVASEISRLLGQPVDRTAHTMLKLIADGTGDVASRWMLICAAVVGAPVLEEIIYRALLQRGLMTLTRSPWPAVLLTSVLFTAVHAGVIPSGSFWPAASLIFTLSVFLGLLFARTGSVVTVMVVHAAFNGVSIAAAVLGL